MDCPRTLWKSSLGETAGALGQAASGGGCSDPSPIPPSPRPLAEISWAPSVPGLMLPVTPHHPQCCDFQ